jgi:hypothetical protein
MIHTPDRLREGPIDCHPPLSRKVASASLKRERRGGLARAMEFIGTGPIIKFNENFKGIAGWKGEADQGRG